MRLFKAMIIGEGGAVKLSWRELKRDFYSILREGHTREVVTKVG